MITAVRWLSVVAAWARSRNSSGKESVPKPANPTRKNSRREVMVWFGGSESSANAIQTADEAGLPDYTPPGRKAANRSRGGAAATTELRPAFDSLCERQKSRA